MTATGSPTEALTPSVTVLSPDRGYNPYSPFSPYQPVVSTPTGLSPADIDASYAIPANGGTGQTIALVDAYNDPNIQSDLATFDAYYGLPAAHLTVLNEYGSTSSLPQTDPGWALEIAVDVEWAHAAAPKANLVLVEANTENTPDLMAAVSTAASHANIVSMSWGGSEFQGEQAYDTAAYFAHPNVTFLAASGDDGGYSGAEWPATSPYVIGVGGTTLSVNSYGGYASETAWSASGRGSNSSGSAGGVSTIYPESSFQTAAMGAIYAGRATPDVSRDGNPNTGLSVYDSVPGDGSIGWSTVGGTSAGTPIWAGIVAAADYAHEVNGLGSLGSSQTLNLLYSLYASDGSTSPYYQYTYHDITTGSNYAGQAGSGYDLVTGLGTPIAVNIIKLASTYEIGTSYVAKAAAVKETTTITAHFVVNTAANPVTTVPTSLLSAVTTVLLPLVPPVSVPASTPTASAVALAPAQPTAVNLSAVPVGQSIAQGSTVSLVSPADDLSVAPTIRTGPGLFLDPVGPAVPLQEVPVMLASVPAARSAGVWDAAMEGYLEEASDPFDPEQAPAFDPEETSPGFKPALAAAVVFAAWGLSEFRSRRPESDPRRRAPGVDWLLHEDRN